ncbi:hypothetical protein KJ652_06065 [Patescibacteria group bacterium]|nr:hypothetical protein [Patescibacteria group bacterium]
MRKPLIEQCEKLHIRDVKVAIPKNSLEVTLGAGSQILRVIGKLTNLKNGYRYYFLCSYCGKPYEALYSVNFAPYTCRKCLGGVYASTRKKSVESRHYEHE